jgi:hypothetical protein
MKIYFLLAMIILILLTGCTSTRRKGGENLSSAMNKSRNSNPEERVVDDGEEDGNFLGNLIFDIFFCGKSDNNGKNERIVNDSNNSRISEKKLFKIDEEYKSDIALSAGYGNSYYTGNDIKEIKTINLSAKVADKSQNAELAIGVNIGSYKLKNSFEYKDTITPQFITGFELKGKGGIGNLSKNIRLNAGGGMSWNYLTWDYKNPIYSKDGGYVITDDNIMFIKIFGLIGVGYSKKDSGYVSIETYPEVILTAEDTRGGFRNDVFKNHFGLGYRIEIGQTF